MKLNKAIGDIDKRADNLGQVLSAGDVDCVVLDLVWGRIDDALTRLCSEMWTPPSRIGIYTRVAMEVMR